MREIYSGGNQVHRDYIAYEEAISGGRIPDAMMRCLASDFIPAKFLALPILPFYLATRPIASLKTAGILAIGLCGLVKKVLTKKK